MRDAGSRPDSRPTAAGPDSTSSPAAAAAADTSPVAVQQATPMSQAIPTHVDAPAVPKGASDSSIDSIRVAAADVTRRAAEVFGDAGRPDSAATPDSAAAEPSWDIEVRGYESTNRVEHYVRYFSGPARERIQARLERGTRYEPMIRAKMRQGGLPEDMYYLALIESGFDPNAYSRAAAVGMWQFMTSTARDMGMRVDWWVDERRDPIKSTGAAVRFIKGLRDQFGSLYLAAAAYNGGPGRIARGLTRYADDLEGTTGDDLFFALAGKDYLRHETREYVPQLIAAALIAKEPAKYGMKLTALPAFSYDSVRVGPSTPLAAVAQASEGTVAQLQELNPQILRGLTPPRDSFLVRIPPGRADSFAVRLAELPRSERVGLTTMETKKGQTLESIARKTGLTARQLSAYNPKIKQLKSGRLSVGQTILVPTEAVASAAVSVPDPAIERYSSSRSTVMHVVKSGETLSGIAKRYHATTQSLMRANGLKRALIFPGQTLVVHGSTGARIAGRGSRSAGRGSRGATSGRRVGTGAH